jgi:hypothetical protein
MWYRLLEGRGFNRGCHSLYLFGPISLIAFSHIPYPLFFEGHIPYPLFFGAHIPYPLCVNDCGMGPGLGTPSPNILILLLACPAACQLWIQIYIIPYALVNVPYPGPWVKLIALDHWPVKVLSPVPVQ